MKVNSAQDGAVSPVEVQKVAFSGLPPQRMTPGPRVFISWGRVPVVMSACASASSGKEKPRYRPGRVPAAVPPMVILVGGVVAARAVPAARSVTAAAAVMLATRRLIGVSRELGHPMSIRHGRAGSTLERLKR